MIDFKTELEAN